MKNPIAKASQLINASVEETFRAFVDPDRITQFWLASASAPLSANARVTWHFMVPGAVETAVVDDFQPPRLIAFTWSDGLKVRLTFTEHAPGKAQVAAEAQ